VAASSYRAEARQLGAGCQLEWERQQGHRALKRDSAVPVARSNGSDAKRVPRRSEKGQCQLQGPMGVAARSCHAEAGRLGAGCKAEWERGPMSTNEPAQGKNQAPTSRSSRPATSARNSRSAGPGKAGVSGTPGAPLPADRLSATLCS